ncbi:MAG: L-threonylcarbamoyladenylate synthase [Candidatus Aenigmatarchaeota archaeon]
MDELVLYRTYAEDDIVARAVAVLVKGGLVVYPTDTVYALGADATNPAAVDMVFTLKQRPQNQPLSVLVHDFVMLKKWAVVSASQEKYMRENLPNPYTFVLKPKRPLPVSQGNVGFRIIPNHWCGRISKVLGKPITATSANIHERHTPTFNEIRNSFGPKVGLYIDAGKLSKMPSQVVDLTVSPPRVLRE